MKQFRSWWTVLPVSALVLSGCNEKKVEEVKADAKTVEKKVEAVVDKVTGETPAPVAKTLTPGERAAFLGIAGHLSKDCESAMSVLDGKEIVKRLRGLKTWGFIRETSKKVEGSDPEDEISGEADEVAKFVGQEFFLVTGKGAASQFSSLVKFNQKTTYFQFRAMTQAFASAAASGDMSQGIQNLSQGAWAQEAIMELMKDSSLIDSFQIPPVLAGIKAADADTAGKATQGIMSVLDEMSSIGPAVSPVSFTKGGTEFKGYKIAGEKLAEMMEQGRADMEQQMDPAAVSKLIDAVKKKNIVVASGTLDTYVMVYIGSDEESCPLVDKVEDSLAANDDISFVDGYASKKVVGLLYVDQNMAKANIVPAFKPMTDGIRDGLAGSTGFGDTRDLAAMLDGISEKEAAILALAKPATTGGLVVLDGGVSFELFGGTDQGMIDYDTPHKIGKLPSDEDTVATAVYSVTPAYHKLSSEMGEAMIETAYALTSKVSGLDFDDPKFSQFKSTFAMFDEKFRPDLVGVFQGVQTAQSGLSTENAFVVDFKGAVPPITGIPQEVVTEGHAPRASILAPVTDRTKLTEGWTKIDTSLRSVLKTVSTLAGQEIPMQQPISSQMNDIVTWTFPLPMTNEDFMPSVTVSDKWFVASTSKKQALDLIGSAQGEKEERKGAWMEVNFAAVNKFAGQWVDLVDKYGEKVIPDEDKLKEFRAQLPLIRQGLEAAQEWDKLEFYTRKEGGKIRTTLQFKMK